MKQRILLGVLTVFFISNTIATPVLHGVVKGGAHVEQSSQQTIIRQNTASTTISWSSFNVPENHSVEFVQPHSNAIAINSITSNKLSSVLGSISANGRIVFLNPNGFYFGVNSSVSANTFIASATSITESSYDHDANRLYIDSNANINGSIEIHGNIHATNKLQLIARNVVISNSSSVSATNLIKITASQEISLQSGLTSDNTIDIFANQSIVGNGSTRSYSTKIESSNYLSLSGNHQADSKLEISANSLFLNNTVYLRGRDIIIRPFSSLLLSSTILAERSILINGSSAITLLGASLTSVGGRIAIGLESIPLEASKQEITISDGTTLEVSADERGDGGTIAIISGGNTNFYGKANANGGSEDGNGGFIEISAKNKLNHNTLRISTQAPHGTVGTILIDPRYVVITDSPPNSSIFQQAVANPNEFGSFTLRGNENTLNDGALGVAVALFDNFLVVGASNTNQGRGATYLYDILRNSWLDLRTTTMSPIASLDPGSRLGAAVAINENFVLIGAPHQATPGALTDSMSNAIEYSGNAYLYRLDGTNAFTSNCKTTGSPRVSAWCDLSTTDTDATTPGNQNPILDLNTSSEERYNFGTSVALNNDIALIGAHQRTVTTSANIIATNRGSAYLYRLDGTNRYTSNCTVSSSGSSPWCDLASTPASPIRSIATPDRFGWAVSLNGNYAAIGINSTEQHTGNAYLYRLDGTNAFSNTCAIGGVGSSRWCNLANTPSSVVSSLPMNSSFGTSLSLNDNYLLIGARNGGERNTIGSQFKGTAYLYNINTREWIDLTLSANSPFAASPDSSQIGWSVALGSDYAIIGAPNYQVAIPTSTEPGRTTEIGTVFSFALCTIDMSLVCPSGVNQSNPFINYVTQDRDASLAGIQNTIIDLEQGSRFGSAVAVNQQYIVAGAPFEAAGRGNVYLFRLREAPVNQQWINLYTRSTPVSSASDNVDPQFGFSVAVSSSTAGTPYVLIGAPGVSGNRGTAYLYDTSTTNSWLDLYAEISPTNPIRQSLYSCSNPLMCANEGSRFGASVGINGTYAIIGAPRANTGPMQNIASGDVFVYDLSGTPSFSANCMIVGVNGSSPWCAVSTTAGFPVLSNGDEFGSSLAITQLDTGIVSDLSNNLIAIGAPGTAMQRGGAYLYKIGISLSFDPSCGTTGPMRNQNWCSLESTFLSPIGNGGPVTVNSRFGHSIDISQELVLIGVPEAASGRGNAYLYRYDNSSYFSPICETGGLGFSPWCDLSSETSSQNPVTGLMGRAQFGFSVALNELLAVIGAPGAADGRGNAYLYRTTNSDYFDTGSRCAIGSTPSSPWCDLTTTDSDTMLPGIQNPITELSANSRFGETVSLNTRLVAIGAPEAASGRGNAYLYSIDTPLFSCHTLAPMSTSSWCNLAESANNPILSAIDPVAFGSAISLNDDFAVFGSYNAQVGVGNAYIYQLDGGTSLDQNCQMSTSPPSSNWCDLFTPLPDSFLLPNTGSIGTAVAINDDFVLIGVANAFNNRGNAYLYQISTATGPTSWLDLATTSVNSPITTLEEGSLFGAAVDLIDIELDTLDATFTLAIIGAPGVESNRGTAYLFVVDSIAERQQSATQEIYSRIFNNNCELTSRGEGVSSWCNLAEIDTNPGLSGIQNPIVSLPQNSSFGTSVAINRTVAAIGAPGVSVLNSDRSGDVLLYRLDGNNGYTSNCATSGAPLSSRFCRLNSSRGATYNTNPDFANSTFGNTIAINSIYLLLGVPDAIGSSGTAFLYRLDGTNAFDGNCATTGTLTSPWCVLHQASGATAVGFGSDSNALAGLAVALNEEYAAIGAPFSNLHGDAFLYRLDGTNAFDGNCATTGTLTSPWCRISSAPGVTINSLANGDRAGNAIGINDRGVVVIGAPFANIGRGNAFYYNYLDQIWTDISQLTGSPISALPGCTGNPCNDGSFAGLSVDISNNIAVIGTPGLAGGGGIYLFALEFQSDAVNTTVFSSAQIETMLTMGNIMLTADLDVSFLTSVNYTGSNRLMVLQTTGSSAPFTINGRFDFPTSHQIAVSNIQFIARNDIGTEKNPIIFGTLNSTSQITSTDGDIHVGSRNDISSVIGVTINPSTGGSLSFTQLEGTISITSTINHPNALVSIIARGAIGQGNITVSPGHNIITARTVSIRTLNGSVGTSANPIQIDGTVTNNGIFIKTGSTGSIFLVRPSSVFAYTQVGFFITDHLILIQETGNIRLVAPFTTNDYSITLDARTGSIRVPSQANILTANNITINAMLEIGTSTRALRIFLNEGGVFTANSTGSIFVESSNAIAINSITSNTSVSLTLTGALQSISSSRIPSLLTTPNITSPSITIFALSSTIGTSTNPLTIFRNSGTWNSSNLSLTTSTSIYLRTEIGGVINSNFSQLTSGVFSLEQTVGNISINSAFNRPNLTILLNASAGAIETSLSHGTTAITASSLSLTAATTIGSMTNPIYINRLSGNWAPNTLSATVGTTHTIFIGHQTNVSSLVVGTYIGETVSFTQSMGTVTVSAHINLPMMKVVLRALNGSISSSLMTEAVSASELTLITSGTAAGIGSSSSRFIIDLGSSGVLHVNSTGLVFLEATRNTMGNIDLGMIAAAGFDLDSNSITVAMNSSISTDSLQLRSVSSGIGTSTLPLRLNRRTTGTTWTSANLRLATPLSNSIVIEDQTAINDLFDGTFLTGTVNFRQVAGTVTLNTVVFQPTINIGIFALSGAITSILTATAITASSLTLEAMGDIGSSGMGGRPISIDLAAGGSLTTTSDSVYISSNDNLLLGGIRATNTIELNTAGIRLMPSAMVQAMVIRITTTGDIGTPLLPLTAIRVVLPTPLFPASWDSTSLVLNAGTNSIFLSHPTAVSTYFPGDITGNNVTFEQITGNITIENNATINLPSSNVTIRIRDDISGSSGTSNILRGASLTSSDVAIHANSLSIFISNSVGLSRFAPIVVSTSSGSWSSANLNVSATNLNLESNNPGLTSVTFVPFMSRFRLATASLFNNASFQNIYLGLTQAGTDEVISNTLSSIFSIYISSLGNIVFNQTAYTNSSVMIIRSSVISLTADGTITIDGSTVTTANQGVTIASPSTRLLLTAMGSNRTIGSLTHPLRINGLFNSFSIDAGTTGSVFIISSNLASFIPNTPNTAVVAQNYSLTQTTGNVTLPSLSLVTSLFFQDTNLTIVAPDTSAGNGNIAINNLPLTVRSLVLMADKNITSNGGVITLTNLASTISLVSAIGSIGSQNNPISITSHLNADWSSTNLTVTVSNAATSGIFLSTGQRGLLSLLPANFLGTYSITQTAGNIDITNNIIQPSLNLILTTTGSGSSIMLNSASPTTPIRITVRAISLLSEMIISNSSDNRISAPTISLFATRGDIGTATNRIWVSSDGIATESDFTFFSANTSPTNRMVFLRRTQNTSGTAHTNVMSEVQANRLTTVANQYTVTVYDDASSPYNPLNDLRFVVTGAVSPSPPARNNVLDSISSAIGDVVDAIFRLFGSSCDRTATGRNDLITELLEPLC